MAWLDDHPPARSQFRCPRRADPSGVIAVHTAESVMDTVGPDTGAEAVASFIRTRSEPGSYHELVDTDSHVHLVRWTCEAFHDATGTNPHSMGLSFACSYLDWPKMTATKRKAFLEHGAQRAVAYARWVYDKHHIVIPARHITAEQARARVPGFVFHLQLDPGRRKDPGASQFPLDAFLARYTQLMGYTPPTPGDPHDMAPYALWKLPDTDAVYHVPADATSARKIDSPKSRAFDQALLRLGGHDDSIHEATGNAEVWLRDLLRDAGLLA